MARIVTPIRSTLEPFRLGLLGRRPLQKVSIAPPRRPDRPPAGPVGGAVRCLAVWGGLVLGGCSDGAVRAWDVETLEEAADGPAGVSGGGPVRAMVADAEAGEVWCAVGRGAAVWRRVLDAGAGAVAGE